MKIKKFVLFLFILSLILPVFSEDSKNPVDTISLHFLRKYLNVQLKGLYTVSYIGKTKRGVSGIIQRKEDRIAFPFFINFLKPGEKKEDDYPYKFKGLPANKLKDGTIIVKINDLIEVGVKKPLNGYGNPVNVLKLLDVSTAIEKATK